MKKILILMIAFVAVALMPQAVNAQEQNTADKKEVVKTNKGDVVPITKEKGKTVIKKEGKKMEKKKDNTGASKNKPREAVIVPLKNPKENKVVVGKPLKKDKKAAKKSTKKKGNKKAAPVQTEN